MKQLDQGSFVIFDHNGQFYMRAVADDMVRQLKEQKEDGMDHLWFRNWTLAGQLSYWVATDYETHEELDAAYAKMKGELQ